MCVLLTVAPGGRYRRDEARGVAGDQQFLIGRHRKRQPGWCARPSGSSQECSSRWPEPGPAVRMSAYGHAVAEGGYGRGDLQEAVVLGHAFAAGRGTGLEVATAGADGQVGDEVVLGFAGAVRDEPPVAGLAADGHGFEGLGHGADLVELDQRGVADAARD